MSKRVRLIPSGIPLIRLSLFYWVTYTFSVILFTVIATLLYLLGFSEPVYFVTAFSVSSLLLVGMYIRRLYQEGTQTLNKIYHQGQTYLAWADKLAQERDAKTLKQSLQELRGFIRTIESLWMGKRVKSDDQQRLCELHQQLTQLEITLERRILETELDDPL